MTNEIVRPAKLGNIWLIAATVANSVASVGRGGPQVVTIDPDGELEAVGADHPEYEVRLLSPGFVCTLSDASEMPRVASRLRSAALATGVA